MPKPIVDFPVFDADNHMYETTDAFTKFLPPEYSGLIKYVEVNGRTKIAVRNVISEYIPNPTFNVVGRPGASEELFKHGNPEGKTRREIIGEPIRSPEAFFSPEPRLALMDELGLDRALMWPTLASLLEERLADDPIATHIVVHALNQWMHEHWTFNYEGRIFASPVITLPIVDKAIEELEWVAERGAKLILIRPAPVPGYRGYRSFALPEFDPFWQRVTELDVTVGMHASDDGLTRYYNQWEGNFGGEHLPFAGGKSAFMDIAHTQGRGIFDTVASLIGHGLLSPVPDLAHPPRGERRGVGAPADRGHGPLLRPRALASTRRIRSWCSSATSGSTRSTRRTRAASSTWSAWTVSSSGRTTRTSRGCPSRCPTSTSSRACRTTTSPR